MIERLVVWGGNNGDGHSHRWIHRAFYENALKLGIEAYWAIDDPEDQPLVVPGSTVIAADVWSEHIPAVPGTDYVLHNMDGSHPLFAEVDENRVLRLQVHTDDAFGEQWATFRHYDRSGRILFQPWGTDLSADEFMDPVYNPTSHDVVFVGAIWSDQYEGTELGNVEMISELHRICAERKLSFNHLTQVSPNEQLATIRNARLAPAFAGNWQVEHNYLPCRAFKAASYGQVAVTNVPALNDYLLGPDGSLVDKLDWALGLSENEWTDWVFEQQEWVGFYTYEESLYAIDRALEAGR